jgi:hypothetical protein
MEKQSFVSKFSSGERRNLKFRFCFPKDHRGHFIYLAVLVSNMKTDLKYLEIPASLKPPIGEPGKAGPAGPVCEM